MKNISMLSNKSKFELDIWEKKLKFKKEISYDKYHQSPSVNLHKSIFARKMLSYKS